MSVGSRDIKDFECLLSRCSAEAQQWQLTWAAAEELRGKMACALKHLHNYDTGQACACLADVDRDLAELEARDRDSLYVPALLRRQYWSEMAYLCYMEGDLGQATECVDKAEKEMAKVLERHFFLIPLAFNFVDILLQRARIARREYQYPLAKSYLERLAQMYSGQAPICVLPSGRAIYTSDVQKFLDSLDYDEGARRFTCQDFIGDLPAETRMANLEVSVFYLPDLVIPYP